MGSLTSKGKMESVSSMEFWCFLNFRATLIALLLILFFRLSKKVYSKFFHPSSSSTLRLPSPSSSGSPIDSQARHLQNNQFSGTLNVIRELPIDDLKKPKSEQCLVKWASPQLHDADALAVMVDPALRGLYPPKSLPPFAEIIALCVKVVSHDAYRCYLCNHLRNVVCNSLVCLCVLVCLFQTDPMLRPTMLEVVQSLVQLVKQSNMNMRDDRMEEGEDDSVIV
ncbi:hypothetical protein V6N13_011067 [Hibiscus sabdariffa]